MSIFQHFPLITALEPFPDPHYTEMYYFLDFNSKWLGKYFCDHFTCSYINKSDLTVFYDLSNEVIVGVSLFVLKVNGLFHCQKHSTLTVAEDRCFF